MMTEQPEEQIELQDEVVEETPELSIEDQLHLELHEANEAKLRALADFKNYQQ